MLGTLLELAGFGMLVAFAYLCWPPAALVVGGVGFIVGAQAISARGRGVRR